MDDLTIDGGAIDRDLAQLGDQLEAAVAAQIVGNKRDAVRHEATVPDTTEVSMPQSPTTTAPRRRSRRVLATAIIGGVVIAGAGTAAAVSLLSTDTVARGLPGGAAIFTGTNPSCTTTDDIVFACTLQSAPTVESQSDYTGSLFPFVDDASNIAGGCRGDDVAGLHWTCYAGQRAVDEGVFTQDMLGAHQDGPSHG